jgi:hypothetical protein
MSAKCYEPLERHGLFPTTIATDADTHIAELRTWLATHEPREGWSKGQRQAYDDRLRALAGWLAKAQLCERSNRCVS